MLHYAVCLPPVQRRPSEDGIVLSSVCLCMFVFVCLFVACAQGNMPVLRLLSGPKMDFSPRMDDTYVAPINVKFGTGERTAREADLISRLSELKCGNTAHKTVKIWNFGHKFAP